ncbi:unnamed protein product [Vitrella brassicaformis CCMP3155]|uniref:Uncharacterized protein n=1 Tax=Vitrella brassicaformis (strain CCMP3155) TaxID=1169540 RepID=A0A0G4EUM4_VITBC|nr:unnamed protein product [Vitrella brassicaformis CCMP3155]|eukprot:CEM02015.1 unnamed protein product [Vitrella brassicaformis CCMP3155]
MEVFTLTGPEFTLADEVLHLVPYVHLDGLVDGCIGMREGESRLVKVSTAGSSGGAEQGAADAELEQRGRRRRRGADGTACVHVYMDGCSCCSTWAREVPDLTDALARQAGARRHDAQGAAEPSGGQAAQAVPGGMTGSAIFAPASSPPCSTAPTSPSQPETLIVEHGKGKSEASKGHDVSKVTKAAALSDYLRRRQAAITQELQASFILDEIAEREGLTVAPDELQINIDTVQQDMKTRNPECSRSSRQCSWRSGSSTGSQRGRQSAGFTRPNCMAAISTTGWTRSCARRKPPRRQPTPRQTPATAPNAAEAHVDSGCSGPAGAADHEQSLVMWCQDLTCIDFTD